MKLKYMSLAILFILISILSACAKRQDGKQRELIEEGKFVYTASGEFKPFSYMNDDMTMTGFDIEVGAAIAKELGLEPVQKQMKFKGIVEGVKTGRADVAVASHTINDARAKHVLFSTPYYYSGPQIFTRPDSNIKTANN